MSWSKKFDDPIPLPEGGQLETLREAAEYIELLPAAEQQRPEWQTAIYLLIGAAEGRDFIMHARVGVVRALHRHPPKHRRR